MITDLRQAMMRILGLTCRSDLVYLLPFHQSGDRIGVKKAILAYLDILFLIFDGQGFIKAFDCWQNNCIFL